MTISENWLPAVREIVRSYVATDEDLDIVIAGNFLHSDDPFPVYRYAEIATLADTLALLPPSLRNDAQNALNALIGSLRPPGRVTISDEQRGQIFAAADLVKMIVSPWRPTPGRKIVCIVALVQMLAAIRGAAKVETQDVIAGLKLTVRPLTRFEDAVLRYAMHPDRRSAIWRGAGMLKQSPTNGEKRMRDHVLTLLTDENVAVLERSGTLGRRGYSYALSAKARKLVSEIDPHEEIYDVMWPYRVIPDRRAYGLA